MNSYTVTWTIQIDGRHAQHAALIAREIQLDPENIATHYHVQDDETGEEIEIDVGNYRPEV